MNNRVKSMFRLALAVLAALLLAACLPVNGDGKKAEAPEYVNIQPVGNTIELIFDRTLSRFHPEKVKVRHGSISLKVNADYTLKNIGAKLVIRLEKRNPGSYTITLGTGAVTSSEGEVNIKKAIKPVVLQPIPSPVFKKIKFVDNGIKPTQFKVTFNKEFQSSHPENITVERVDMANPDNKVPLNAGSDYSLKIQDKQLIITLTKRIAGKYTVSLKAGAVADKDGRGSLANEPKEFTVHPEPKISRAHFEEGSNTKLTVQFNKELNSELKNLERFKDKGTVQTSSDGVAYTNVDIDLNTDAANKPTGVIFNGETVEITLAGVAISGNMYRLVMEKEGLVSAEGIYNKEEITSEPFRYWDRPMLDAGKSPHIQHNTLIATFNKDIALSSADEVKVKVYKTPVGGTKEELALSSVVVGADPKTLEISLPAVQEGETYRLALNAGAVHEAGEPENINRNIAPENLDITIEAAPALVANPPYYRAGDKIYFNFNAPVEIVDESRIKVRKSTPDPFATLDLTPTLAPNNTQVVIPLGGIPSRDLTYRVSMKAGALAPAGDDNEAKKNAALSGAIEQDIKITDGPTLPDTVKPAFSDSRNFRVILPPEIMILPTVTLSTNNIIVQKKNDTDTVFSPVLPAGVVQNDPRMLTITLANDVTLITQQWKVVFPADSLLDINDRNTNRNARETGAGTFQYLYHPANKAELIDAINVETLKGAAVNFNAINTQLITDMSSLFSLLGGDRGKTFNGDISSWNVGNVTNMDSMFYGAAAFNQDISGWNVSAVTNMGHMFDGATSFNQDISSWNVSAVTDMQFMFRGATSFNNASKSLAWGENTKKVGNMSSMFENANAFDQDISSWNVSAVTDMQFMFRGATSFNNASKSLAWGENTKKVGNMQYMFDGATSFNQDISSWNVSAVTDMQFMFRVATSFNNASKPLAWGENTKKVGDMKYMFYQATSFNQDVSSWNVSAAIEMGYMFDGATSFNQDISSWNVSAVTTMDSMFSAASVFNTPLAAWWNRLSVVTDMSNMFAFASAFNQDISSWQVPLVSDYADFRIHSALTTPHTPPKFR